MAAMREPWSIVADHPANGEPFGIVMEDGSFSAIEAESVARSLLATSRLTGAYLPTADPNSTAGHYLFLYRIHDRSRHFLGAIWALSQKDADLRLNILAEEGILFMPSSG